MFPLHDRTRRRVAVAAFLLLAVLPTVIVLGYGVARKLPGHARREAARLATHLGLDVALDGVGHPRPGAIVYRGLRLTDPETGHVLLQCGRLEARFQKAEEQGRPGRELVMTASQTTVHAAELDGLRQLLGRVLRRRTGWPETDVRATADQLTLQGGPSPWSLAGVEGRLAMSSAEASADLRFRLAGAEMPEAIELRFARNRRTLPVAKEFTLDTGGAAVSCELLALGMASLGRLGPESRFRGRVQVMESSRCGSGELAGQFLGIDLARLAADQFGHQLTGKAELSIEGSRFRQGRIEQAAGTFRAGPGVIGRPLLEAAQWLGITSGTEQGAADAAVPYERLAVAFSLDARGLSIRGECPGAGPNVVATGRDSPLLSAPAGHRVPPAAVVAALASPDEVSLPATPRTAWLLGRLPMAGPTAPATTETPPGNAP